MLIVGMYLDIYDWQQCCLSSGSYDIKVCPRVFTVDSDLGEAAGLFVVGENVFVSDAAYEGPYFLKLWGELVDEG